MKRVKGGYAFKAVITSSDIGIKEDFKVVSIDNTLKVDTTFGVDTRKEPVKPAVFRQGSFIPLKDIVDEGDNVEEALNTFIRSNKAVYSVMKSTFLICRVSGRYDVETDSWSDDTRVCLYTPRTVGRSKSDDYVICAEVTKVNGVDTVVVSESIISSVKESVLKFLSMCVGDRELFIGTRAGVL